jgi:predicted Fe-S protein YdhL (DUF1289 family)
MVTVDATMRYFDLILSETLASASTPQADRGARSKSKARLKARQEESKKESPKVNKADHDELYDLYQQWMRLDSEDEQADRIRQKIGEWHKKNPQLSNEVLRELMEKNADRPGFQKKLQAMRHHHNDNLVTWMLRHLVNKAEHS